LRQLTLAETAHAIVTDSLGIVKILRDEKLDIPEQIDAEMIFRFVLENKTNENIVEGIIGILKINPYNQHCVHCMERIQTVYDRGLVINNQLKRD